MENPGEMGIPGRMLLMRGGSGLPGGGGGGVVLSFLGGGGGGGGGCSVGEVSGGVDPFDIILFWGGAGGLG